MSESFKKALLEFLRTFAITLTAEVLRVAVAGEIDWRISALAICIPLLRAADKWLHEEGKAKEEETGKDSLMTKGLVRF